MNRESLWIDSGASIPATISIRSMQTCIAPVWRRFAMYVSSDGTTCGRPVPGLPRGGCREIRGEVPAEPGAPVRGRGRRGPLPQIGQGDHGGRERAVRQGARVVALDDGPHQLDHVAYSLRAAAQMAVVELVVDEKQPYEPVRDEVEILAVGGRVHHADERTEVRLREAVLGRIAMHQTGVAGPFVEVDSGVPDVRVGALGERAVDVRQFALHGWVVILSGRTFDGSCDPSGCSSGA